MATKPKRRIQTPDLELPQETLNATLGRTTDGFASPGRVSTFGLGSNAKLLARSLGVLADTTAKVGTVKAQEQIQNEIEFAKSAMVANNISFGQAVADGLIPEGMNPYAIRAVKEYDGSRVAKNEYIPYLRDQIKNSGWINQSFDTELEANQALNALIHQKRTEFVESDIQEEDRSFWNNDFNDLDFATGFRNQIENLETNIMNEVTNTRINENKERLMTTQNGKMYDALDVPDVSPEARGNVIGDVIRDSSLLYGLKFKDLNTMALTSVGSKATELADAGLYDDAMDTLVTIDHIETSPGNFLGKTRAGRDLKNKVVAHIQSLKISRDKFEVWKQDQQWKEYQRKITLIKNDNYFADRDRMFEKERIAKEEKVQKDYEEAVLGRFLYDVVDNPEADYTNQLREMALIDPAIATKGHTFLNGYRSGMHDIIEDPQLVSTLKDRALTGELKVSEVVDLASKREITIPHAISFISDINRKSEEGARRATYTPDQQKEMESGIKMVGELVRKSTEFGMGADPAQIHKGVQAQALFEELFNEYIVAHPHASKTELLRKKQEMVQLVSTDPTFKSTVDEDNPAFTAGKQFLTGQAKPDPLTTTRDVDEFGNRLPPTFESISIEEQEKFFQIYTGSTNKDKLEIRKQIDSRFGAGGANKLLATIIARKRYEEQRAISEEQASQAPEPGVLDRATEGLRNLLNGFNSNEEN